MERFTLKIVDKPKSSLKNVCRLCGMDNPQKFPILRDDSFYFEDDVPLVEKISVCCGIQVTKKDKMSQKICPLCSDKINDFYEFREMCSATNLQTRQKLGLPLEAPAVAPVPEPPLKDHQANTSRPSQTILEPPIIEEAKTQPVERRPAVRKKVIKRVIKKKIQTRSKAAPVRTKGEVKEVPVVTVKAEPKVELKPVKVPPPAPASKKLLQTKKKVQFAPPPSPPSQPPKKRGRKRKNPEEAENKVRAKKNKVEKAPPPQPSPPPTPPPQMQPKVMLQPIQTIKQKCSICVANVERQAMDTHMMEVHTPRTFDFGCGPCGVPFDTRDEYKVHQDWHRKFNIPYRCFKCRTSFPRLNLFTLHLAKSCEGNIEFSNTVPNTQCTICGEEFATFNLYNWHGCFIRANSNCPKCNRFIQRKAVLFKHIFNCTGKGSFQREREMMEIKREQVEKESQVVKKVQPLKIKILDRKKYTTGGSSSGENSDSSPSRVIKSEPDSMLELEESRVSVEGPSLHTTLDDIRSPVADYDDDDDEEDNEQEIRKKLHKKKKERTVKNPIAAMILSIKQEPKDTYGQPSGVSIPRAIGPRVKQEPVDNGYENAVKIAARNIKKERIDPPEEEFERDEADEEEDDHQEAEEENLPTLPQGVRIKQEPLDRPVTKPKPSTSKVTERAPVLVKKEPTNTYEHDSSANKAPKKRIFKIPSALIRKLQQEKEKSQQEQTPVITEVRSGDQGNSAPKSPFIPIRIKSEFEKSRKKEAPITAKTPVQEKITNGSTEESVREKVPTPEPKRVQEKDQEPGKEAEDLHKNPGNHQESPEEKDSDQNPGEKSTENQREREESPEKEDSVQNLEKDLPEKEHEPEEKQNQEDLQPDPVTEMTNDHQKLSEEIDLPVMAESQEEKEISEVSKDQPENLPAENSLKTPIPDVPEVPVNGQNEPMDTQDTSEANQEDDDEFFMDSSQLDAPQGNLLHDQQNGQPEQENPSTNEGTKARDEVVMM